eukprot:7210313-Pyramimonas_sp.AAC.1
MLAKKVIAAVPSVEMVRFCNSGTEACMGALRLMRAYTGKNKILKFEGCYHGHADPFLVKVIPAQTHNTTARRLRACLGIFHVRSQSGAGTWDYSTYATNGVSARGNVLCVGEYSHLCQNPGACARSRENIPGARANCARRERTSPGYKPTAR